MALKTYHNSKIYKERTKRWHDKRIKKKEFTPEDKVFVETEFCPVPRTHAASRKGPLDGADPPSFNARVVDPAQSSRDVPVNLTLQLTRRESLSVIKDGICQCCQIVPNVRLREPI